MSDSPIKIKFADKLVMGEWVARYWNGSFVGWHMVVKPFRANIVLTASRVVDEPVQEFETAAAAPVKVWAGQGEPPYYGPGDYKNARALQGLKEENERLKEENAQLLAEVARLTAPPPQEAGKTHPQRAYDRLPSPVRSVVDAYARELFEEIPNQTFHALVVSVWNLARQHYAEQDAVQQRMLSELEQKYTQLQASSSATNDDLRAQVVRVTRERDRVSADLVHTLHTLEEIEGLVGKLEKVAAAEKPPMEVTEMTTLPQWLFKRYKLAGGASWEQLSPAERASWTRDAMAVLSALEGEGLIKGKARMPWGIARHLSLPLDLLPKDLGFGICHSWHRWDMRSLQNEYYVEVPPNHIDAPDPPDWLVPIFAYAREHNAHGVLFHSRSKTKYDPLTSPKMRG